MRYPSFLRALSFYIFIDPLQFPNSTYANASVPYAEAVAESLQSSPPKYPSPWSSGAGEWSDAYAKARNFVSQLTLLEKVNLTTGTG